MTAPVHPGGERWIVDCGDGCTTEFDTEAEAVAYADACIQDWCDDGWMEEVDNIFVARLTHRSQRHVVAVQDEVSEEEWGRVTHGGSGFSEWWEYTIEPLGSTPQAPTVDSVPVTPSPVPDLVKQLNDSEADRIWGLGNWIVCEACPNVVADVAVRHHKDFHGSPVPDSEKVCAPSAENQPQQGEQQCQPPKQASGPTLTPKPHSPDPSSHSEGTNRPQAPTRSSSGHASSRRSSRPDNWGPRQPEMVVGVTLLPEWSELAQALANRDATVAVFGSVSAVDRYRADAAAANAALHLVQAVHAVTPSPGAAPTVDSGELGPWCCYADEVGVYAEGVCTEDDPRHAPTHCGYDNVRRGLIAAPAPSETVPVPRAEWEALVLALAGESDAAVACAADDLHTAFVRRSAAGVSSDR